MKKTRLDLNKKLILNKDTVTELNNTQQSGVKGGDWATNRIDCEHTQYQTNCQRCTNVTLEPPQSNCL